MILLDRSSYNCHDPACEAQSGWHFLAKISPTGCAIEMTEREEREHFPDLLYGWCGKGVGSE